MAIAKRPKKETPPNKELIDEKQITALIEKGGSATKANQPLSHNDDKKVAIRLLPYRSQLDGIEKAINETPKRGKLSRHAWILQAIDEKLDRHRKKKK